MNSSSLWTRRQFLQGCSAAIAAMAGSRLSNLAFADPSSPLAENSDILICVFLRGGWDALNVIPPIDGPDRGLYESARANLKIATSGQNSALKLDDRFGFHPALAPLHELYKAKHLAVVHATGLTADTRSHFDAMQFMELGTPGAKASTTGWITRHLNTIGIGSALIPALAAGNGQPISLSGLTNAAAMSNPSSFKLAGHWKYIEQQQAALRQMYGGSNSWIHVAGLNTLNAIDTVEQASSGNYAPANGATYPNGGFGDQLKTIAQIIKMNLGLRAATVDLGGWDTHENQGDGGTGYLSNILTQLSQGLAALYTDLDGAGGSNYTSRVSMVVMSEFGRRVKENANHGTDHGHGSAMLVLGGGINGGQVYGNWPGLANEQLYDRADLAVTTDYRQVLGELVVRRLGNKNLGAVFAGINYAPLGVAQGTDDGVTLATPSPSTSASATPQTTATSSPGMTATPAPNMTATPTATPAPAPTNLTNQTFLPLTANQIRR